MTREDLKPCPFCGSRNIKIDKCTARVRCGDCFATSGIIRKREGEDGVKAAVEKWNERYNEPCQK